MTATAKPTPSAPDVNDAEVIDDDELPRAFGAYLLLQNFARGGMGDVYLAKSGGIAGLERTCVVKKLRAELSQDREYVTRFVDEARIVVTLNHANICNVFDVGRVGRDTDVGVVEEYYLAMEYVSGRDLRSLQERCRKRGRVIDPVVVVHLVGEVLKALDYAHRRRHPVSGELLNLVHRDVSPQNVLVSYEGEIKLIDFGLAASRLKVERTQPNIVMGKMAYMPPEQARGDQIDSRADLFACGVLLYELLTNERYYEGMTANDIWQMAGRGGFVPRAWGGIDPFLQVILGRALHPDPRRRIATCGELREELLAFGAARNGSGAERALRELMESLFVDEIARERAAVARFGTVTIASFRGELEGTRSHAVTLVPPTPVAAVLDEATCYDSAFDRSSPPGRAQTTTEEGTPMPSPKPSSSFADALHDDPTRLQQRPDLTSDVVTRPEGVTKNRLGDFSSDSNDPGGVSAKPPHRASESQGLPSDSERIHDERTVLTAPRRTPAAERTQRLRAAPRKPDNNDHLDDSHSDLTAREFGIARRPVWIAAVAAGCAVVIAVIVAVSGRDAVEVAVVAPGVATAPVIEAVAVEAPAVVAPIEAPSVDVDVAVEPTPVEPTPVVRVNAAPARPRPPSERPIVDAVVAPPTPKVSAPARTDELVTAAAWHRFYKGHMAVPCVKSLWELRQKISEGAFLRVESDTIRACAVSVGERL